MARKPSELPGDRLMSIPDVARYLSVERSFARRLVKEGYLGPVYDVATRGNRLYARVRLSEVEKYLADRASAV